MSLLHTGPNVLSKGQPQSGMLRLFLLVIAPGMVFLYFSALSSCWVAGPSSMRRDRREALEVAAQGSEPYLELHGFSQFLDKSVAQALADRSKDPFEILATEMRRHRRKRDVANVQQPREAAAPAAPAAPAVVRPITAPASGAALQSPAPAVKADPRWDTIWTYWDYPKGPDYLVQLNLDTWRKWAPEMKLVLINESNIRQYVPDCPDEFFRLPYAAAKSDFVRASLLYHHGGVYMDTDFMLLGPLREVLQNLEDNDIVSYSSAPQEDTACLGREYSSNWLAGKKGNVFHKTWWDNMKFKLTRMCDEGDFAREMVCCHEAYAPQPETRSCHIPWAHLEWLKNPSSDSDARGPPKLDPTQAHGKGGAAGRQERSEEETARVAAAVKAGKAKAKQLPKEARLYCLNGPRQLAPHHNGEVYWQPWNNANQTTGSGTGWKYDLRFACKEGSNGDLVCTKGNWGDSPRTIPRFFRRTAYHIFFSARGGAFFAQLGLKSKDEVFKQNWLLGELYRRSLGYDATN